MSKPRVQNILLVASSICLTMLGLELALRVYHGDMPQFESLTAAPSRRVSLESFTAARPDSVSRTVYHSRLGWVRSTGRSVRSWTSNVDAAGLRSNGTSFSSITGSLLAVGDSFTFGNEVEDYETWPARLAKLLNRRVLNAGVGAYGIDQAVLRAELLLDEYRPDIVLLAFISDDINRAEYSHYPWGLGWKPYFEFANGSLVLRNVPVPRRPAPHKFQALRSALGYSFLANAVLGRTAPRWWRGHRVIKRIHNDGENVSVALLVRLRNRTINQGGQFFAIALATNGRIGDNARLPNVICGARKKGVEVLDLATPMLKFPPDHLRNLFRPGGHYSPEMNDWVADQIAAFLYERGIEKPAI